MLPPATRSSSLDVLSPRGARYNGENRNVARDLGTINETRTARFRTPLVIGAAVLLSTVAVVADEVITSPATTLPGVPWMLAVFFAAFAITSSFAVWTARDLGLPTFLLLSPLSGRRRWLRLAVYGVGVGILIYLTNGALYLTTDEDADLNVHSPAVKDYQWASLLLRQRAALLSLIPQFPINLHYWGIGATIEFGGEQLSKAAVFGAPSQYLNPHTVIHVELEQDFALGDLDKRVSVFCDRCG